MSAFLGALMALCSFSVEAPALAQKAGQSAKKKGAPKTPTKPKPKPKTKPGKHAAGGHGANSTGGGVHNGGGSAAGPKKAEAEIVVTPVEVKLPLARLTLDNGLRVVMNADSTSPTIAISVVYDVGGRNDAEGRSGFAHLFEHMMFQGSTNVKKGEHNKLIAGRGGISNATTSSDRTSYYEVLPRNELALGLWLEAERMESLIVTQENFENQRNVVKEEFRSRVSNVAYVKSALRLGELVFQGYAPYERPSIGNMADLDAAQFDWVKEFHSKYYGPGNAVLAISGDFEEAQATALVHQYFDKIPKITLTPFVDSKAPDQNSERTAVIKDEHALTPAVFYGWQAPKMREKGAYALSLAATILGDGESSRLYKLLVREKALAQDVSAHLDLRRSLSMFEIDAQLVPDAKMGNVEKLIDAEVKALSEKGPSEAELAKAKRRAQAKLVFGLQTNGARAQALAEYELFFGDAGLLAGEGKEVLSITADEVKKAATDYLATTKRTVVETYPQKDPEKEKPSSKAKSAPVAAPKTAPSPKAQDPNKSSPKGSDPKKKGDVKKKGEPKKKASAKPNAKNVKKG